MAQASMTITERRLNWYGNVMRGYEELMLRKALRADNTGESEQRTTENKTEIRAPTGLQMT